ncbi:amidohydrolase family protein [Acuticoccus kandeliae]|uniref:amidohydrolase family protein n=1 Tax=Acuticoccus kandeliae TaxID=2073160 RepID=UPI000D3EA27B|nr:amidohydrolase family protein [Acuticoccus kandeliae]
MVEFTPRHVPVRHDWLADTQEAAIDPARVIIDPHHHLWERPESPYLAPDLVKDLKAGHNVVATVYVEAHAHYREGGDPLLRPIGEVEFAAEVGRVAATTRGTPRIAAGIIGTADLNAGARVGKVLDLMIVAGEGRFCGIRSSSVHHPDPEARGSMLNYPPGVLEGPAFREGLAELMRRGLTFDAWMYHTQLDDVIDLARAFPDLPIILNHVGGAIGIGPYADKRDEVFAVWREAILRVGECPNIRVKIGGLGMRLFGFGLHDLPKAPSSETVAEVLRPYVETAIEAFGPDRAMFESNFPVDKGSFSYVVFWNALKRITAAMSEDEKTDLFARTAARTYALPVPELGV